MCSCSYYETDLEQRVQRLNRASSWQSESAFWVLDDPINGSSSSWANTKTCRTNIWNWKLFKTGIWANWSSGQLILVHLNFSPLNIWSKKVFEGSILAQGLPFKLKWSGSKFGLKSRDLIFRAWIWPKKQNWIRDYDSNTNFDPLFILLRCFLIHNRSRLEMARKWIKKRSDFWNYHLQLLKWIKNGLWFSYFVDRFLLFIYFSLQKWLLNDLCNRNVLSWDRISSVLSRFFG